MKLFITTLIISVILGISIPLKELNSTEIKEKPEIYTILLKDSYGIIIKEKTYFTKGTVEYKNKRYRVNYKNKLYVKGDKVKLKVTINNIRNDQCWYVYDIYTD